MSQKEWYDKRVLGVNRGGRVVYEVKIKGGTV